MPETSVTVTTFDTQDRNVLVTTDRKAAGFPEGVITGLIKEAVTGDLWIGSTGDPVSAHTELVSENQTVVGLSGTRTSGSYEGPPIDLGAIINGVRLTIEPASRIIPDPVGTLLGTEYAEADNGSFTPFAPLKSGDLGYKKVKEKIVLSNNDNASNIGLSGLVITNDVPDVRDNGTATIAVAGTTVSFARTFTTIPQVNSAQVIGAGLGAFAEISAITETGFFAVIKRVSDGVDIGGTLHWGAEGF